MTTISALMLACLCGANGQTQELPKPSAETQELCQNVLARWEPIVRKDNLRAYEFIQAWADLDPGKAVDLAAEKRFAGERYVLLRRFAADGHWQQFVSLVEDESSTEVLGWNLWPAIVDLIGNTGDQKKLDFVEEKINALQKGLTPKQSQTYARTLNTLRFLMAAAKLEMARAEAVQNDAEFVSVGDHRQQALAEMKRVSGDLAPVLGPVLWFGPNSRGLEDFIALESWTGSNNFSIDYSRADQFSLPLLRLVSDFSWSGQVRLPPASSDAAKRWIGRQMLRGRHRLAIAYLARAAGSDTTKGSLLAEIAGDLPDDQSEFAARCLTVAAEFVRSGKGDRPHAQALAMANLAMAFHRSKNDKQAHAWMARGLAVLRSASVEIPSVNGSIYSAKMLVADKQQPKKKPSRIEVFEELVKNRDRFDLQVLYQLTEAAILTETPEETLPESLRKWLTERNTKFANRQGLRGDRSFDLSKLAAPGREYRWDKSQFVYEGHRKYNSLVKDRKWADAIGEARELSKGNAAWASSYPAIARKSVRADGLPATLEWIAEIDDANIRFRAEIAAVREALSTGQPAASFPMLYGYPSSLTPGISWSYGC